jgi:acyl-coenzyme A thioesterase PaaI-like protein
VLLGLAANKMGLMSGEAFQDQMVGNHCWGCGSENPEGLHLKSYWYDDVAVAEWSSSSEFMTGPRHVLNGGIIATLLDCHGVCTAVASAYRRENRAIGTEPAILYVTASMTVDYLRPTPIDAVVRLGARLATNEDRMITVECVLEAAGKERARASVRAVRVSRDWRHAATGSTER